LETEIPKISTNAEGESFEECVARVFQAAQQVWLIPFVTCAVIYFQVARVACLPPQQLHALFMVKTK